MYAPRLGPRSARRCLVLPVAIGLLLPGCAMGAAHDVTSRGTVVNELSAELDHNDLVTPYTATYRLGDGTQARVTYAVHPRRVAYVFDSGRWARTNRTIMSCTKSDGTNDCTLRPTSRTQARPQADLPAIRTASAGRFVPTEQVLSLLTAAAEDPTASLRRTSGRRIAGQPATCVRVTGGRATGPFDSCVTHLGVLARFAGRVRGRRLAVVLTDYATRSIGRPFDPPHNARVRYRTD